MSWPSRWTTLRLVSALLILGLAGRTLASEPVVNVTLHAAHPGPTIPDDFAGLSFEASLLLPSANGVHYFRPNNRPLITLFHTLGIKSLRIGGNTSDRDARKLPEQADLDSLFAFAKAADVKVIYCLRLYHGDTQADVRTARYIMNHYAAQMDCFSIGQEPSAYPKPYAYADYRQDWRRFAEAIIGAAPDVKFCGPSVHRNGNWARNFMADFGHGHHVALVTEHLYAGGAGNKVPSPEIGRDRMLSDDFTRGYQKLYNSFVPMAISNGLPYRLEEANNYYNGGARHVSDTFAAALWGLDFLHWWAAHGASGINFHSGDRVAAGYTLQRSKYAAFVSAPDGYDVRPLGYGLQAFDLGGHGRILPVSLRKPRSINLTAYAVLGEHGQLYVTLINKSYGPDAQDLNVALRQLGSGYARAQVIALTAPHQNVAAASGETLGDAKINSHGHWDGKWTHFSSPLTGGNRLVVPVPAATAAVVKLTRD